MTIKQYQFLCNNCHFKKIIGGNQIGMFVQVKQSDINRGSPKLEPETNSINVPPPIKRKKVFKCPNCGFVIRPTEVKEKSNETDRIDGSQTSP